MTILVGESYRGVDHSRPFRQVVVLISQDPSTMLSIERLKPCHVASARRAHHQLGIEKKTCIIEPTCMTIPRRAVPLRQNNIHSFASMDSPCNAVPSDKYSSPTSTNHLAPPARPLIVPSQIQLHHAEAHDLNIYFQPALHKKKK
jgi:hypothetical protein